MNIPAYAPGQGDQLYNDQLSQSLVNGLSDSGWTLPQQTTTQITGSSANMPNGTMWYDNDSHTFKIKVNGTVQTVTTT